MGQLRTLLNVIVSGDGKSLIVRDGEQPYLVTTSGKVVPLSHIVTLGKARQMIDQLLPQDLPAASTAVTTP